MSRLCRILLFFCLLAGCLATQARSATAVGLDTLKAHKLYIDGDFDKAIAEIEQSVKAGKLLSHGDSVFAYKHLGVMYAANESTRERGKHYMFLLLAIEPTARIMDMFASDLIYMIFKNVQEEFELTQGGKGKRPKAAAQSSSSGGKQWVFWTGGAVAVVGVAAAWWLMQDPPRDKQVVNVE